MLLLGEFEHAIDAKNRLAVPADIRDVLNASSRGESLIAAPGSNGSLWLWPETTFENLADELGGSFLGDETMADFERTIFSQSARCPLDSAGRVRLPERLKSRYGLSGSVIILGARNHLELMTPSAWKEVQAALPSDQEIWARAREAAS